MSCGQSCLPQCLKGLGGTPRAARVGAAAPRSAGLRTHPAPAGVGGTPQRRVATQPAPAETPPHLRPYRPRSRHLRPQLPDPPP
ncbi:hypothetical protein CP976_33195 [Streptomyces coeruleorubidus]|uniref:Uncharacterized protein n=1 Tax=Streptomyces coeruleorubidus TaxID=116188 RepID=A0A5J6I8V4_STRC4|nr:hypothetical protein CP976_33195 [Streptomyces coeruleorubidus]